MLAPFLELFPDVAEAEMRSIFVPEGEPIPQGHYGLLELYCVDPACDCRRVSVQICRDNGDNMEGMISHAFDGGEIDPVLGRTYLDPLHRQADYAPKMLQYFVGMLRRDTAYAQRLEQHYLLVKSALKDPKHPIHANLARTRQTPRGTMAKNLAPGTIGTKQNPAVFRVRTPERLAKITAMAEELGVQFIIGIEPDQPEDISDTQRIGQLRGAPSHLSRHERRAWEKKHRRR